MSLTASQWKFISARLLANTDKEAAASVGLSSQTVANWKYDDEEFVQEYEASFADGVEVAKSYTRKLLGLAAQRLAESLDATAAVRLEVVGEGAEKQFQVVERPDFFIRLQTVKLLFQSHGLLKEQVEHSGKLAVEQIIVFAPRTDEGDQGDGN